MPSTPNVRPVLIVDDDATDIDLTQRLLHRAGVTNPLLPFTDSSAALAFLRRVATGDPTASPLPCVMFLDIKMPGVHGFVLLKWARRLTQFDPMRIVMLSGSNEPKDHVRAMKLGADNYLVKFPPPDGFAREVLAESGRSRGERLTSA